MNSQQLLKNIQDKIPLANHMGLQVLECSLDKVAIAADFDKNRNHKMTAFGGSVATVLTLACWSWITNYLDEHQWENYEVSIFKCQIEYLRPITSDFVGVCEGDKSQLESFCKMLERKSKGRLHLTSF
ncbi:MAG: YiiD C-terminal domain-containing protein, partial [Bdellovibrionales bacterium]|nr:YiiD C-terminal domain-containing protein [Bdellovibrionales bacterium]